MTELSESDSNEANRNMKLELGRYIYYFQSMCNSLQFLIINILKINGLNNDNIARVVIGDCGADRLQTMARHMVDIFFHDQPKEKEIAKKCFNFIRKIIEKRNIIIHSTWFPAEEVSLAYKVDTSGKELLTEFDQETFERERNKCIEGRMFLGVIQAHILFSKQVGRSIIDDEIEIVSEAPKSRKNFTHND